MTYEHGATPDAKAISALEENARRKAEKLAVINEELDARMEQQAAKLKQLPPVRTYKPTPQQLAYRDKHGAEIAALPRPIHGGQRGLARAIREAEEHEARKTQHP